LSRLTVYTLDEAMGIMFETAHRHGVVCQNLHTHMTM